MEQKHSKPYVPLWKQFQQSKEFQDYKQNDLPKVEMRMSSLLSQIAADKAETDRIKERDLQLAKEYQLRYIDKKDGKLKETKHNSEKSAKDRARELSLENSPVQVGEVDGGRLLQQWNFEKGRIQAMDTKKQVSVASISKKEASTIPANTTSNKEHTMATKAAKKTTSKATKTASKAGKGTKAQVKAKTPSPVSSSGKELAKKGTVRDFFELREGSNKEKLVDALLGAKGKALGVTALLKATYGNGKEENKGALMMVMKGVSASIEKNKIKMTLVKEKMAGEEMTFALKAK